MKQLQRKSINQYFELVQTPRKRAVMKQDRQEERTVKKKLKNIRKGSGGSLSQLDHTREPISISNEMKWVSYEEKHNENLQKYRRNEKVKKKPSRIKKAKRSVNVSHHMEAWEKLVICVLFSLVSVYLFERPKETFSIVGSIKGSQENVFEILTNRVNETFLIQYENEEEIIFSIKSKKTVKLRVEAQLSMGYKIMTARSRKINQESEHLQIQFTDFMVLDFSLEIKEYLEYQNGFFNTWQLFDNQFILQDIKNKYRYQIQQKAFELVPMQQRMSSRLSAQNQLESILNRYESWFQVLLRKLDFYVEYTLSSLANNHLPKSKNYDIHTLN